MEGILRGYIFGAVIWVVVGVLFGLCPHETTRYGAVLAATINALAWPIAAPVGLFRTIFPSLEHETATEFQHPGEGTWERIETE
jgi:hypothetical protein